MLSISISQLSARHAVVLSYRNLQNGSVMLKTGRFFSIRPISDQEKKLTMSLKCVASLLQTLLFPIKYRSTFPNRHFFSLLSHQLCTVKKMNSLFKYCLLQRTSVKILRPYFIKYLSYHHHHHQRKKMPYFNVAFRLSAAFHKYRCL